MKRLYSPSFQRVIAVTAAITISFLFISAGFSQGLQPKRITPTQNSSQEFCSFSLRKPDLHRKKNAKSWSLRAGVVVLGALVSQQFVNLSGITYAHHPALKHASSQALEQQTQSHLKNVLRRIMRDSTGPHRLLSKNSRASTNDNPQTMEQYWDNTELSFQLLKDSISNQNCYSSQKVFVGCLQAIERGYKEIQIKEFLNSSAKASTNDAKNVQPELLMLSLDADADQVVDVLTPSNTHSEHLIKLQFVRISKSIIEQAKTLSVEDQVRFLNKINAARWQKWLLVLGEQSDHAEKTQTYPIEFSAIVDELERRAELVEGLSLPMLTANVFNEFLKIGIDARTSIYPTAFLNGSKTAETKMAGVGIAYSLSENGAIVLDVINGSPAESAGIRKGDIIVGLEEEDGRYLSFKTLDATSAFKNLAGIPGTAIHLDIIREERPLRVRVVRKILKIKKVEIEKISYEGNTYGLITLADFYSANSPALIRQAIENFDDDEEVVGYILNLRGNGGGLVAQAIDIADIFLGPKKVVTAFYDLETKKITDIGYTRKELIAEKPLVVLQDSNSASASELLAGALRDQGAAFIIGDISSGKGSAQLRQNWQNIYSAPNSITMSATISIFLQPSLTSSQLRGIYPHLRMPRHPEDLSKKPLREQDYFPTSIVIAHKEVPVVPNIDEVNYVKSCVDSFAELTAEYGDLPISSDLKDLQLLSAVKALGCLAEYQAL